MGIRSDCAPGIVQRMYFESYVVYVVSFINTYDTLTMMNNVSRAKRRPSEGKQFQATQSIVCCLRVRDEAFPAS